MDELTVYTLTDAAGEGRGEPTLSYRAAHRAAVAGRLRVLATEYVRTSPPELVESHTPPAPADRGEEDHDADPLYHPVTEETPMDLSYLAVVTCGHTDTAFGPCSETAEYTAPVSGLTVQQFGGAALVHFRGLGWLCGEPGNDGDTERCPKHHRRPTT